MKTSNRTAQKITRWNANQYQKWLDVEAKLIGLGKLKRYEKPQPVKSTSIVIPLEEVAVRWVPYRVLLNDMEWTEWQGQWEGDIRPFTTDKTIWHRHVARFLTLLLPVNVYSGGLEWTCPNTDNGRISVDQTILDDGEEKFLTNYGDIYTLKELVCRVINGCFVYWTNSESNGIFYERVRRQYLTDLPPFDIDKGGMEPRVWVKRKGRCHVRVKMANPNSTAKDWEEVKVMRHAKATAAFFRRKTA